MAIQQVNLPALNGSGQPITVRSDQQTTDLSYAMRAALEIDGQAASPANPVPVSLGSGLTITQTVVTLTAGAAAQLIAANPLRRFLAIQVASGGDVTLGFPTAAAGAEWLLTSGGRPMAWDSAPLVPLQAIGGVSAASATVVVLEGV